MSELKSEFGSVAAPSKICYFCIQKHYLLLSLEDQRKVSTLNELEQSITSTMNELLIFFFYFLALLFWYVLCSMELGKGLSFDHKYLFPYFRVYISKVATKQHCCECTQNINIWFHLVNSSSAFLMTMKTELFCNEIMEK